MNWIGLSTFIFLFGSINGLMAQSPLTSDVRLKEKIDSIVAAEQFSGVVLVTHEQKRMYEGAFGYADLEAKTPISLEDQFVIGSISKQITAVLVLREVEKGTIELSAPLKKYLPTLEQEWSANVTVHHLLTHTHGIVNVNEALVFEAGSQFQYSQVGFDLLAKILENVTGASFEKLSMDLFSELYLKSSFHPDRKKYRRLVKGYEEADAGQLKFSTTSLANYPAAGAFISSAEDLNAWNYMLHAGTIVQDTTLRLMKTRYATRIHPIFESIEYGYGLLFKENEQNIQIGALGYADGFSSASFYFPAAKMSVVVLSNVARNLDDFKRTFTVHTGILEALKAYAVQE